MKSIFAPSLRYPRLLFLVGLLFAAFITWVCLIPAKELPQIGLSDKFEHTLAYVALGFWFGSVIARRDYIGLYVALVAFGGAIEIAQYLMHVGRQAEWYDLLADAVGALAGILLAATPLGRWPRLFDRTRR